MAKTMVKLRAFLDAEAKRDAGGNGIKPIERVPIKIVMPGESCSMHGFVRFADCRKKRGSR